MVSNATFRVDARRSRADGAREVVLPYFATVMRGGTQIVSKRLGRVALRFAAGQLLASTTAAADATISRAAATLPGDVSTQLTRKRRPTGRAVGGIARQLRTAGRLSAQPGSAAVQRDALRFDRFATGI